MGTWLCMGLMGCISPNIQVQLDTGVVPSILETPMCGVPIDTEDTEDEDTEETDTEETDTEETDTQDTDTDTIGNVGPRLRNCIHA